MAGPILAGISAVCAMRLSAGTRLCRRRDSRHTRARPARARRRQITATMNLKVLEWSGVITAIVYSLFVASNAGLEFLGFVLLFASAISIGA